MGVCPSNAGGNLWPLMKTFFLSWPGCAMAYPTAPTVMTRPSAKYPARRGSSCARRTPTAPSVPPSGPASTASISATARKTVRLGMMRTTVRRRGTANWEPSASSCASPRRLGNRPAPAILDIFSLRMDCRKFIYLNHFVIFLVPKIPMGLLCEENARWPDTEHH